MFPALPLLDRAMEVAAAGGLGVGRKTWCGDGLHLHWLPYQGGSDPSQVEPPSRDQHGHQAPVMCLTLKLEDTDSLATT